MVKTISDTPVCKEALEYVGKVIRSHIRPTCVSLKAQADKLLCTANGYEPLEVLGTYDAKDIKNDIYKFGLYWSASIFTPDHDPNTVIISLY